MGNHHAGRTKDWFKTSIYKNATSSFCIGFLLPFECLTIHLPCFFRGDIVSRRPLREMWIVMNEFAEQKLAISLVLQSIQNVLMPEIVQVLRPRDDRSTSVVGDQKQELPILFFNLIGTVIDPPPEAFSGAELLLHRGEIQIFDEIPTLSFHDNSSNQNWFTEFK